MNKYKCNKCGKIVNRDSEKIWMYSFCCQTNTYKSRLYKMQKHSLLDILLKVSNLEIDVEKAEQKIIKLFINDTGER